MRSAAQSLTADVLARSRRHSPAAGIADALVGGVFAAAARLAAPVAAVDEMLRPDQSARLRARLRRAHAGRTDGSAELRGIWFARIAREGLRILLDLGFADAVLRRVEISGNTSALRGNFVYAIYHTPWGRVLALWLARQSDGALYSAPRWLERARSAHVPCTWRGLRELISRIGRGGSAAVTADQFGPAGDRTTAVSLLGRDVHVSTGVARIAATAGVAIVPVVTRYRAGMLQISLGAEMAVDESSIEDVTRRTIAIFDAELRRDPSGWELAHRFLSAPTLGWPAPG